MKSTFFLLAGLMSMQSCSNFGAGLGGYEKPSKTSNRYYTRNFHLAISKLHIARRYVDFENKGLNAANSNEYSYFTFFDNGFVLHNSGYKNDLNNKPVRTLNYNDIYSEDVGSFLTKADTIFWGTRPGYQKKKSTQYYSALITDSGLHVLTSKSGKIKFFRAQ